MEKEKYVIGLDFGTDSCRAILVNALNGHELAAETVCYPRWQKGLYCDPSRNQYRQHPLDYIETMEQAITSTLAKSPKGTAEKVVGIGIDTTGSTPVLIDKDGTPLSLLPEFADAPDAMFILWKDHTAIQEASEINRLASSWGINYTSYSGGVYSSEWVWAKMMHLLRTNEFVWKEACSWVEHCDWIPALLTGKTKPREIVRSRCAAGHKAMWNETWNGLPSFSFFEQIEPLMECFRDNLYSDTFTSDCPVGTLTPQWARTLGLPASVIVATGAIDCHMGAVGAQIEPGSFVRVIGTSTCDIMITKEEDMNNQHIKGICGQVVGSVVPGYIGLEAGQSAFGDIYAWYKKLLLWPVEYIMQKSELLNDELKEGLIHEMSDKVLTELTREAEKISLTESAVIATDWLNGRRTPFANQNMKGVISGLTLGTTAPMLYRALVEATAFGSKAIVDSLLEQGVKINSVVGIGGISLKSPFVMQILSDVLGMPIKVARVEQACALGAAMFAAVAANVYTTTEAAQVAMGSGFAAQYNPNLEAFEIYKSLYLKYKAIGSFVEEKLF